MMRMLGDREVCNVLPIRCRSKNYFHANMWSSYGGKRGSPEAHKVKATRALRLKCLVEGRSVRMSEEIRT